MSKVWNVIEKCMYFFAYKVLRLDISTDAWKKWCQFVKFGIVGLSNTIISYTVYAILVLASFHYVVANLIGFLVSVFNAYYWNTKYVFKEQENEKRVWWKTLAKTFFAYAGTGLILANILLVFLVKVLSVNEMLAPILILFVTTPINFLANKLWAYRAKLERNHPIMEPGKNIGAVMAKYQHILTILIFAAMPLLSCMFLCFMNGIHLQDIYIANSTHIPWNDEIFYYKMIEGTAEYGQPLGYFGYSGNHANIGRFGAWSPLLLFFHIVYAKCFGWSLLSPIYCNIVIMTIAMAVFAYLARPTKRQTVFLCLLYCSCTAIARYMLSMMMEIPTYALILIVVGIFIRITKSSGEEFKIRYVVALNLLILLLVLMRPYWLLLSILPGYYWYQSVRKKSVILIESVWCFVSLIFSLFISSYFCAEYFDQGIINLEMFRILRHNPVEGIVNIIHLFTSGIWEILQSIKDGIFHGYHEGGVYLIFLIAMFYFVYKILLYKNADKRKAWINGCWLFCFCAMLLAIVFLYEIKYGARHAIAFIFLFIFIFSFEEISLLKYMILLITFIWLFCVQTKEVNICPIPLYTEEKAAALQKGRIELADADFIDLDGDNPWDNTIIWLYQDETKTDFTYFYALPEGIGIELYFKEDLVRCFEELQPRYIMTNIGEEVDLLCEKEDKEKIAEYGNVHIWRLRE